MLGYPLSWQNLSSWVNPHTSRNSASRIKVCLNSKSLPSFWVFRVFVEKQELVSFPDAGDEALGFVGRSGGPFPPFPGPRDLATQQFLGYLIKKKTLCVPSGSGWELKASLKPRTSIFYTKCQTFNKRAQVSSICLLPFVQAQESAPC